MTLLPIPPLPPARRRPVRILTALAAVTLASTLWPQPAQAHSKAHQHGVAKLDVVIDGNALTIELDTPLDNLVGFERAPRTPAERQRVDAMTTRLKTPETLFKTDAAAACSTKATTIEAPVLGLGTPSAGAAGGPAAKPADDHADLNARFEFECRSIGDLRQIDVALFSAFSGFKRLEVQMAGPKGQSKRTLTPASARLPVAR